MKFVFLGGTSYLGSKLINHFKDNHEITLIKRGTSFSELESFSEFDILFNLVVDYGKDSKGFDEIKLANYDYPVERIQRLKVKTIINFSTGLAKDLSHYSKTKCMLEETLVELSEKRNFQVINLKLQHFYAADVPLHNFFGFLINKLKKGEDIPLTDGLQRRDFIYIKDLLNVVKLIIQKRSELPKALNVEVGSGKSYVIKEVVKLLKAAYASKSNLNFGQVEKRANEPEELVADISKLKDLGFEPQYDLVQGIKDIMIGENI